MNQNGTSFVTVSWRAVMLLLTPIAVALGSFAFMASANAVNVWSNSSGAQGGSGRCSFTGDWDVKAEFSQIKANKERCNGTYVNGGKPDNECSGDDTLAVFYLVNRVAGDYDKTFIEWYTGPQDDTEFRNPKISGFRNTVEGFLKGGKSKYNTPKTLDDIISAARSEPGNTNLIWVCGNDVDITVSKACKDGTKADERVLRKGRKMNQKKKSWAEKTASEIADLCFQRCPAKIRDLDQGKMQAGKNDDDSDVIADPSGSASTWKDRISFRTDDGESRAGKYIKKKDVTVPGLGSWSTAGTAERHILARGRWCFKGTYVALGTAKAVDAGADRKVVVDKQPLFNSTQIDVANTPTIEGRDDGGLNGDTQFDSKRTPLGDLIAACLNNGGDLSSIEDCWPTTAQIKAAVAANDKETPPSMNLSDKNKGFMAEGGVMRTSEFETDVSITIQDRQAKKCDIWAEVQLIFRVNQKSGGAYGQQKYQRPISDDIGGIPDSKNLGANWELDLADDGQGWSTCQGTAPKNASGGAANITRDIITDVSPTNTTNTNSRTWSNDGALQRNRVSYDAPELNLVSSWFAATNHCNANQYKSISQSLGLTSPAANNKAGAVNNGDSTKWLSGSLVSNVYSAAALNGNNAPFGQYSANGNVTKLPEFYDRVCVYNGELANSKTLVPVASNDLPEEYTFFRDGTPHVLGKDNGNVTGETPFFLPSKKNDGASDVLVDTKVKPEALIVTRDPEGTPSTKDSNVVGMKAGSLAFTADDKLFREVSATGTDSIRRPTQFTSPQEDRTATVAVAVGPYTQLGGTATWPSEAKKPQVVTMAWYFAPSVRNTFPMTNLAVNGSNPRFNLGTANADVFGRVDAVNDSSVVHGSETDLQDQREMMYDNSGSTASTANNLDRAMPYGANKDLATGEWLTKPNDFNRYYFSIRYVRAVSE